MKISLKLIYTNNFNESKKYYATLLAHFNISYFVFFTFIIDIAILYSL